MSVMFYKFLHISAIMALFLSIGVTLSHLMAGGGKSDFKNKKFVSILHGISLVVILVAGFGLMARMQYSLSEPWLIFKLIAWFLFGMVNFVLYKAPQKAKLVGLLYLLLGATISYVVFYKPGM